jgi:hypothetical protein
LPKQFEAEPLILAPAQVNASEAPLQDAQSVGKKALSSLFIDGRRRQRDRRTEDLSSADQAQLTQREI